MALARIGEKLWKSMARAYQAEVATALNQYGLKYDDLKVEVNPDVDAALKRLPQDEVQMRARRFKRAFDLSFKKKVLPDEMQKIQTPLSPYLIDLEEQAKARRIEREILNAY